MDGFFHSLPKYPLARFCAGKYLYLISTYMMHHRIPTKCRGICINYTWSAHGTCPHDKTTEQHLLLKFLASVGAGSGGFCLNGRTVLLGLRNKSKKKLHGDLLVTTTGRCSSSLSLSPMMATATNPLPQNSTMTTAPTIARCIIGTTLLILQYLRSSSWSIL